MKLLFVADPLAKLHPAGDSSLAMARAAMRRKHEVHWATEADLFYALDSVHARTERLAPGNGDVPAASTGGTIAVRDFQGVFIRKDPPFDESYLRMCWLLALEENRVVMFNRPSLLLRYHEKLLPLEGLAQGYLSPDDLIPTFIGGRDRAAEHFERTKAPKVVTKPFLGFGGRDVELCDTAVFRGDRSHPDSFFQPYLPEVTTSGDRRVLYVGERVLGHFVRLPPKGGFVSNLARGGSAHREPIPAGQEKLAKKVGKWMGALGIEFAGADFIGNRVSEINITSPTGLRSLETLEGSDGADALIGAWEAAVKVLH